MAVQNPSTNKCAAYDDTAQIQILSRIIICVSVYTRIIVVKCKKCTVVWLLKFVPEVPQSPFTK
jgi:hypothetical protein